MRDYSKMSTKDLSSVIDYLVDRINAVLNIYKDCDNLGLSLNPMLKFYLNKLVAAQREFINRFTNKED